MIGRGNSFIAEWWWLRVDDWKGDSFIAEWWWLRVDDWKGEFVHCRVVVVEG